MRGSATQAGHQLFRAAPLISPPVCVSTQAQVARTLCGRGRHASKCQGSSSPSALHSHMPFTHHRWSPFWLWTAFEAPGSSSPMPRCTLTPTCDPCSPSPLQVVYLAVDGLTSTWQDSMFHAHKMSVCHQVGAPCASTGVGLFMRVCVCVHVRACVRTCVCVHRHRSARCRKGPAL